jgi:hypothetical protein
LTNMVTSYQYFTALLNYTNCALRRCIEKVH